MSKFTGGIYEPYFFQQEKYKIYGILLITLANFAKYHKNLIDVEKYKIFEFVPIRTAKLVFFYHTKRPII